MDRFIKLLTEKYGDFDDEVELPTEPSDDDIIVSSNGWKLSVSAEGRHIGDFQEDDEAWAAVQSWMKKNNSYPNIWYMSDHGNMWLVDENGSEIKENVTSNLDGGEGQIRTPGAFQRPNPTKSDKRKEYSNSTSSTGYKLIESIYITGTRNISKILREATYNDFASDDSQTPKQKLNSVIKEVNRKLYEVEQTVRRANKYKGESNMGQDVYWKSTLPKLQKISERLLKISNMIREMSK